MQDDDIGGRYCCPVCGVDPEVDADCEHLFCYGDDLTTMELAEAADCKDVLLEIWNSDDEMVSGAGQEFLEAHENQLPSIASVNSTFWDSGGAPISGVFTFVWAKERSSLAAEVRAILMDKLDEAISSAFRDELETAIEELGFLIKTFKSPQITTVLQDCRGRLNGALQELDTP